MNSSSPFEKWLVRTCENLFPFQAILGIAGNLLNLSVLLSRGMRKRSNTILALAAFSDILFLLALVPLNLSRKRRFMYYDPPCEPKPCFTPYAMFFRRYKPNLTFLVNWFSGTGSWFLVSVSFERLWAIKNPVVASNRIGICPLKQVVLVTFIFVASALLSFHNNISFQSMDANGTMLVQDGEEAWGMLASSLALINMFSQTIAPVFLLVCINFFLLYYLHERRHMFAPAPRDSSLRSEDEMPPLVDGPLPHSAPFPAPRNWGRQILRAERHVTITVVAILTSYVLTHLPSIAIYANMYLFNVHDKYRSSNTYMWVALSSAIVATGKVANFFLFCLSSAHFRRQLIKQMKRLFFRHAISVKDSNHQPATRSIPLNTIDHSPRVTP